MANYPYRATITKVVRSALIPVIGGEVRVYQSGTSTLKSLSEDQGGQIPITQPILTDVLGEVHFFTDPGRIRVEAAVDSVTTKVIEDVIVDQDMILGPSPTPKVFQYSQTTSYFYGTISAGVAVPPVIVPVQSGTIVKLVRAAHKIVGGSSATFKLQRNGFDLGGWVNITATPVATVLNSTDITMVDSDVLSVVVTSASGSPTGLSVTFFFEVTTS